MSNPISPILAETLVGCDGINPYEKQKGIASELLGIGDKIDMNQLCTDSKGIFKGIADSGIIPLDRLQSLMEKVQYIVGGKTDGGFSEVISELQQIEEEIKNSEKIDVNNTKTL